MKAAIYARESSADITKAPDIENQIKRGEQWAKDNSHKVIYTYKDNGYSGGQWTRPGLHQMLKDLRANRFKLLIVWNTDRLARDLMHFADIFNKLNEKNVKVFSITEDWVDMQTAGGRLKHNIVATVNQYEREKTGDKVRMAYQMKKKSGEPFKWGRPKKLSPDDIKNIKEFGHLIPKKIKIMLNLDCSLNTIRRVLRGENG